MGEVDPVRGPAVALAPNGRSSPVEEKGDQTEYRLSISSDGISSITARFALKVWPKFPGGRGPGMRDRIPPTNPMRRTSDQPAYIPSISAEYRSTTTSRLTLNVCAAAPVAGDQGSGTTYHFRARSTGGT